MIMQKWNAKDMGHMHTQAYAMMLGDGGAMLVEGHTIC